MTDLQKLIEAVEANSVNWYGWEERDIALPKGLWKLAREADVKGSLDAAKALHEALLDGTFHFNLMEDEDAGGYQAEIHFNGWYYAGASSPARAWLLAILKAHAQREGAE